MGNPNDSTLLTGWRLKGSLNGQTPHFYGGNTAGGGRKDKWGGRELDIEERRNWLITAKGPQSFPVEVSAMEQDERGETPLVGREWKKNTRTGKQKPRRIPEEGLPKRKGLPSWKENGVGAPWGGLCKGGKENSRRVLEAHTSVCDVSKLIKTWFEGTYRL